MQRLQFPMDFGNVFKQLDQLLNIHFKHVGNRLGFEADLQ